MDSKFMVFIIVIVFVLFFMWIIREQRMLVKRDELCKNALSQIGVQLNSRWDALNSLADLTKSYSEYEYSTLKEVISARNNITADSKPTDITKQENAMDSMLSKLLVISEAYPQLKASEIYINTMNSVNDYEEKVRISRQVYNDTVTLFNSMIRQFPTSIIASKLKFLKRDYLQEPKGKNEFPNIIR